MPSQDTVTDPVCWMIIDRSVAADTREYSGVTYYFCSPACRRKFDADAEAYIAASHAPGWSAWSDPTQERTERRPDRDSQSAS